MSENKKDVTQDAVKQLGAYKTGKLAELRSVIASEKSKAAALMAAVRSRREVLFAEEEAKRAEEERLADEAENSAVQDRAEAKEKESAPEAPAAKEESPSSDEPVEAVKEQEEPAAAAETKAEAEESAPETEAKAAKEPVQSEDAQNATESAPAQVSAENKKEEKKEEKKPKAEQKPERKILPTSNPAVKEEILPNGEVRRIYVPPTPAPKSNIKTRVFDGGYTGGRSPRPQGDRTQQGGRPPYAGGAGAPRRDNMAANLQKAANMPTGKPSTQKNKSGSRPSGGQRFDDRGSMNKRALLKKGYIVDDSKMVLDDEDARVRVFKSKSKSSGGGQSVTIDHAVITSDPVPIKTLSEKTGIPASELIKTLFMLGIIKTINESVDFATAELVVGEITKNRPITLELKPEVTLEETLSAKLVIDDEDTDKLRPRPPVVTIMGHVDHGKTSLLDYIRKANVAGGEAGGITQHIGAYTISLKGAPITFLDTPGHEAFTSMRARGAQVTDVAVLVVAADDGIMPQTVEAINHARQAEVPIIVAINKIDKPGANPDQVLQQLTNYELLPEEWGGETPVVRVSAKTGEGVESLLENILTMAEIRELKANPDRPARGTIIEARLDKGVGKVATILVQTGTLRIGDNVVAGTSTGKIRAMVDDKGRKVKKAGPSTPVSVTGWDEVPEAGDIIDVVADEKFARELAEERRLKLAANSEESGAVSLNDLFDKIKKGELKSVKLIIKADVQGSLEAVKQSLSKLGNEEVDIDIIHGAVGAIKESDVTLADTAKAIIIGFNVRPDANAKALAAQKHIDIRFYDIIYNAIEDIEKAVKGMLEPKFRENVLGTAEVREVFRITGAGIIAGCHVTDGKIVRGAKARLLRSGAVQVTTEIASLRHGKDDVKEMAKNFDCGIMLLNYQDIKVGDVIEAFVMEQINED